MTPEQAMARINTILSHAWMVRTFLKHSEDIQEDEELLEVHRMIFDYTRALEPSFKSGNVQDYLRRAAGKLPKLRRVSELFAREFRRVSDHTNYHMAAASLTACVDEIGSILDSVTRSPAGSSLPAASPAEGDPEPDREQQAGQNDEQRD